jgi:hypothetical protein
MNEREPISLTRPKLLIGEGIDEFHVFGAVLKHVGLDAQIQVLPFNGKPKLGSFLRTLPTLPGFNQLQSLGITRDADASAGDAQKSIAALIQNAAFPAVLAVKVFVLPGGDRSGALEDLCCDALGTQPVWPCIDELVACRVRKLGNWPNPAANAGKARLQAWLSTLDRPGLRLGETADSGQMPFNAPAFAPLLSFIRSL